MLVEDAVGGRATPLDWFVAAIAFLGDGVGARMEAEYVSIRQEVGMLGGVMPEAPGS